MESDWRWGVFECGLSMGGWELVARTPGYPGVRTAKYRYVPGQWVIQKLTLDPDLGWVAYYQTAPYPDDVPFPAGFPVEPD